MTSYRFIFKIPEGMNYKNMPVYSGKILVMGSNGDEVSIPYLGMCHSSCRGGTLLMLIQALAATRARKNEIRFGTGT